MQQNRRSFLDFVRPNTPAIDECWLHVNRMAMACKFEVTLPRSEEAGVIPATEALDEIDRLEAQLTIFRETSEVSHVNAHASEGPVRITPALFELLQLCKKLSIDTAGTFDVTSGPLTRCWGFLRKLGRIPDAKEIANALSLVGSHHLELDDRYQTVKFSRPGVEINLGSIGKGYALDSAASLMIGKVKSALLNAGSSSMRAIGAGDRGQGWEVGLRHPRSKFKRLGVLRLRNCALSTSGTEEQFFDHEGKRYGHIIDPRTGWPTETVTSVSVVTSKAALSDALATAFFVGGRSLVERYCATHDDVLVVMLEANSNEPLVIGRSSGCDGLRDF